MADTDSPAVRLQAALDRIAAYAKAPVADSSVTEAAARLDRLIAMIREALDVSPAGAMIPDA